MLYKTGDDNLTRSSNDYNSTNDQENDNQGEVIVSRSSSQSIQHPLPDKREALRMSNLPLSTLCAYINHKVTLCKPITRSKAISCAPITFNRATQTLLHDDEEQGEHSPPISLLPIPVGLVTPLPLALGTTDCPVPVPIPIPVPLPLFFVVNDQKFEDYHEYLQKLKDVLPDNQDDIDILCYAQTEFPNEDILGLAKFNPKVIDRLNIDLLSFREETRVNQVTGIKDLSMFFVFLRIFACFNQAPLDETENPTISTVTRTSSQSNLMEQDLNPEESLLNKYLYEFESFDLSTLALSMVDQNLSTSNTANSTDKTEYLLKQEDAKFILKWHFGVKLFRAWIENKNLSIQQKVSQRKNH